MTKNKLMPLTTFKNLTYGGTTKDPLNSLSLLSMAKLMKIKDIKNKK